MRKEMKDETKVGKQKFRQNARRQQKKKQDLKQT